MAVDIETIGIGVDTKEVVSGGRDLDSFGDKADKASRKADGLTDTIVSMSKGFLGATAALAGLTVAGRVFDEYTKYTAILKNATSSQVEYNKALEDVRRIANLAQTDVAGLAQTYARFSNALKEFGATQSQVTTLTETVALALKANGASAMETSSAMLQLSQAFGSGRLSGDEFRSMAEAAPNLMRALAASIGVPTGALKELAANGQLTNDVLLKAFTDPNLAESLKKQAGDITTLSGAWQKLKNEISTSFTALEAATGFFKSLAISTAQLADGISIIRGFFKGDQLKGLNDELSKVTNQLQAFDRGNAFDRAVLGGPERRKELLSQIDEISKKIKEITKPAPVNKASLQTPASADKEWMDKQLKDFQKQQDELNKAKEKASKEAYEKERELALAESSFKEKLSNDYQDMLRKRKEKEDKDALKPAEDLAKEEYKAKQKYMDMLSKQAQQNFDDAQREAKRIAEATQREYERINDTITRSLTDALLRGFERGESIAKNFINRLKDMFGTLVLRPAISFVLNQTGITSLFAGMGSIFSGNANAAGGVGGGIESGVSFVQGIKNGFDGINLTFQASIESLGASLAESNFGLVKSLGGMIGQYSSQIANVLPYAGAAFKLLSGDFKGAAFTGAGTAIGSFLGGPVGGAIGSFLGSAVGGLFGKKKSTPRYSSGVSTSYSDGSFSNTDLYALAGFGKDAGGRDSLTSAAKTFSETLNGLFKAFGLNSSINTNLQFFKRKGAWGFASSSIDGVSAGSIGGDSVYNKDAQTAFNNLIDAFLTTGITNAIKVSKLPEGIKALFDNITDKTVMGNMIVATQNLAGAQDQLLKRYGLSLDVAGKVAKATGLTNDELANFTNTLAQTALATQKTSVGIIKERDALKDLIGSLPTSVDAFDAILKSINTSTAEGQKQFADLFQLRDRFAQYTSTFDAAVSNVDSAIYGLLSPSEKLALDQANLAKAFAELNISVPRSVQDLIDLGKSIDYSTESSLDLALAFPALVEMFNKTKDSVNPLTSDLNANYFSTRADYMSAKASDTPAMYIKNQTQLNADMLANIKQLQQESADSKAVLIAVAEYTFKQSRTLDDWNEQGMPPVRVD